MNHHATWPARLFAVTLAAIILTPPAFAQGVSESDNPGLARLIGEKTPLKPGMKIAFFGDSITMQGGYIRQMAAALASSPHTKELGVKLLQHGLNGGRVPTVLEGKCPWGKFDGTMEELLKKEKPHVVVIYVGVNDVWHGKNGTTPEDFEAGLKKMAALCKTVDAQVVMATLATIGERPDGTNGQDEKLDQYAAVTLAVAAETGATPVNLRKAFVDYLKTHNTKKDDQGAFPRKGFLTYDGVHMSQQGNDLLASLLAQAIVEVLR